MFHVGGHKGVNTRGRSSALSRHYPHFLSHVDWQGPLRCGILFLTFNCILFVIGIILTWLGVHNLIGESVPITGPILLSVGGLMFILAVRQFYMAHVRKKAHDKALKSKELGVTAISAIAEQDEEEAEGNNLKEGMDITGTTGVNNIDKTEKEPFITGGCYDSSNLHSNCGDTFDSVDYAWPPVSLQHPYYSMALMVYKDPNLFCAPYLSGAGNPEATHQGLVLATDINGDSIVKSIDPTASDGGVQPSVPLQQQPSLDSAVLETSSFTVQPATHPSLYLPTSTVGSHLECSKIFPADYLMHYQRSSRGPGSNAAISNLPNPTAFTMLRTLELQETI